jgi:uncharacterized protein (DUF885 family)
MRAILVAGAVALALVASCGRNEGPQPGIMVPDKPPAEALFELAESYFEEVLVLNPLYATLLGDERYNDRLANDLSPAHRARVSEVERLYLAAVETIDPSQLDEDDRLTREVFIHGRHFVLEGLAFPSELLPINQLFSVPQLMAMFGSGNGPQPFREAEDFYKFMARMDDFSVWADQAIANMRSGIEQGVVQPRIVIEKIIPQIEALRADDPADTVFWGPIAQLPEGIDEGERTRLVEQYHARLRDTLLPAYARLADFLREEYLPAGRDSVAWTALPEGEAWYAYNVRGQTTTDMTVEEIHRLGLSEVARIRSEMEGVRRAVGFEGELDAFFEHLKTDASFFFDSPDEVLEAYRELKHRIEAALPELFSDFPQADYEMREVEAFRAASAPGASYQAPSADGTRPGIFYVNTFNLKAQPRYGTETLSLHEASPGHHFQNAIKQEMSHLPRFRRFSSYNAFGEGWGLYAESLGPELGLFKDPYQYFGRLNDEQLRAMRLVVDTGLHGFGWTREQAIAYMLENSSLAETDVIAEVERYIAWPGQALGYKIGDIAIQGMRAEAERALGDRFDLKAWHSMVLRGGELPLQVLAARNQRWIDARQAVD